MTAGIWQMVALHSNLPSFIDALFLDYTQNFFYGPYFGTMFADKWHARVLEEMNGRTGVGAVARSEPKSGVGAVARPEPKS